MKSRQSERLALVITASSIFALPVLIMFGYWLYGVWGATIAFFGFTLLLFIAMALGWRQFAKIDQAKKAKRQKLS